jgi:carbohydrate kinase (thermoresistant glucokinase family)
MAAGIPLTDDDRWPWLRRVGEVLARETAAGRPAVVACSALRVAYRDLLREAAGGPVRFVHLHGTRPLLEQRMAEREGHFMPPALLDSQLATLEPLGPAESGIVVDVALSSEDAVAVAAAG